MTVTIESSVRIQNNFDSRHVSKNCLLVSGLTANADNVIPHGLRMAPIRLSYRPNAGGGWGEVSVDATNITIHIAAGGATSGRIDCEHLG
jgi:hypothetical protein